jgi:hypothetical protein
LKKLLNITATILLLFNGIGALYGGWNLIKYPDGSSIQLSLHWLEHTPFTNYFIPGIILFIANGLFSFFVVIALVLNVKKSEWFVVAQGTILTGWLLIQMILIQTIHSLHIILGCVGIGLIITGLMMRKHKSISTDSS